MAQWKKVLVSGSSAELLALKVDNLTSGSVVIGGGVSGSLFSKAINGSGDILATSGSNNVSISSGNFSGSFTGSFVGDGSSLTNLSLDGARIATGSVTASVNVSGSDIFQITSGSSTLFTINADGATFAMGVTASQGFYGTASWAQFAVTASHLSGGIFPYTGSARFTGSIDLTGSFTSSNDIFINGVNVGRGGIPTTANNIVIGSGSLNNGTKAGNTSGDYNIAVGDGVLKGNLVGTSNTAIGQGALASHTGSYATALGAYALGASLDARRTVAIGQATLYNVVSSSGNTAVGDSAMFNFRGGNNNAGLGYAAMQSLLQGEGNTGIGVGVLGGTLNIGLATGSYNTAVGNSTGLGMITGSNNTIIGARVSGLPTVLNNNIILADGEGNIRARYSSSIWTLSDSTVGNFTGSLEGTASWAVSASYVESAVSSSYPIAITGSTIYTPIEEVGNFSVFSSIFLGRSAASGATNAHNSIFLGRNAGVSATEANNSLFFGFRAGNNAINANSSNFIGSYAGDNAGNANNSTFIGNSAGKDALSASYSNFIGHDVGKTATNAEYSNFIGKAAGIEAANASYSNFIGANAGGYAASASYSTLIGYNAGYNVGTPNEGIKSNNVIIGTNITLESGRKDSINLGAVIFATGSYSTTAGNPFSGSVGGGKVGINVVNPKYTLDVSGSGNFTNGLTITGSLVASSFTGSFLGTASLSGTFNGTFSGSAKLVYTASNGLGISTFKYDGSANTKVEVSGASALSNDTVVLWKTGSGVFSNSTISENSQGVYINNTQGLVVAQGGIQVSGSSKFHNNLVVQGDLTVQGTASFQNTTNLEVADQFILLSSGSSTLQDSGIIVNGGSNLSGSALFLETNNTGPNGRWGVQADLLANATTATADQYVVTAKIDGAPTGDPAWGGATNGLGNIWINTGSGDIYIYA